MRKRWIILLCSTAFFPALAAAEKWPTIGVFAVPGGGSATVFVDPGNGLTRHGEVWTERQKTLYTSPQQSNAGADYRSELDVYAYDCAANRTALVSFIRYEGANLTGAIVEKMQRSSAQEYEWITPTAGSILDLARKVVCNFVTLRSG